MRLAAFALGLSLLAAAAACGGGSGGGDPANEPVSPVRGLLTDVAAGPSGEVREITLRADDGRTWTFAVELDPAAPGDAAHLRSHIEQNLPVIVSFNGAGDGRTAHRIDDAPP